MLEDLRKRVREICASCSNKAVVEYFGSHSSGFCKPDSDADLSWTWRSYSAWHDGVPKVQAQTEKKLWAFAKAAADAGMEKVRYVECRNSVVGFTDPVSSLTVDLTVGNVGGVENSKILGRIRGIYPALIGLYINTVKDWAKAREVIAPAHGSFNSFTVTTMALMVLQELGVLPVFSRPTGACGELTDADAAHTIRNFTLPAAYANIGADDVQLGEALLFLLNAFATYYANFDFRVGSVSLVCPRRTRAVYQQQVVARYMENFRMTKRNAWIELCNGGSVKSEDVGPFDEVAFAHAMRHEAVQRVSDTPFVVEDFVNYINCGRRVQPHRAPVLVGEWQRLQKLLGSEQTCTVESVFEQTSRFARTHNDDKDPRVHRFGE